VSVQSGCTGAALARGKAGVKAETIADINAGFPHWFCENYKQFNGKEDELPVDQHMLLALIAPRVLYVSSASEDTWAHPPSEFAACVHAQGAWRLFNRAGLRAETMPPADVPLHAGHIGYHVRSGAHAITPGDWARFLDYAERHMDG
jgi:hypothetical protein